MQVQGADSAPKERAGCGSRLFCVTPYWVMREACGWRRPRLCASAGRGVLKSVVLEVRPFEGGDEQRRRYPQLGV
jgi:hypothetical protein